MRFMILIKATRESEAGVMPSEKLLADMGKFNEELVKAGVMQAGEGLQPSSKGARVRFGGGGRGPPARPQGGARGVRGGEAIRPRWSGAGVPRPPASRPL